MSVATILGHLTVFLILLPVFVVTFWLGFKE